MALPAGIAPHLFTVEEYLRLVEHNPSLADTELFEGVIVDMSPESIAHTNAVEWFRTHLDVLFPGRVHAHGSVQLDTSLWSPDVYVLKPDADLSGQYVQAADVLLIVEVSVTTANRDLSTKMDTYARNMIPTYWVVSPGRRRSVYVFRDPTGRGYDRLDSPELLGGYEDLNLAEWV